MPMSMRCGCLHVGPVPYRCLEPAPGSSRHEPAVPMQLLFPRVGLVGPPGKPSPPRPDSLR
eukprot:3240-Pyramimonas_sp.AAC.1